MNNIITMELANKIVEKQKEFFKSGLTKSYRSRIKSLDMLYNAIIKNKEKLEDALKADLGKSAFESYTSEIGLVLSDISYTKKHLKAWMRPKNVSSPLFLFPSRGKIEYVPFGSVFIMGPFNYPFQLIIEPLIGAIAAGNCAVLSPSELAPHTSETINKMIADTFPPAHVMCIEGGIESNSNLLHSRFDHIFFTGSTRVGKIVMNAAAENLIPVTLELGGKSPVIVDSSANLKTAAERIIWGKLMNAGQTCVAPDYVLAEQSIFEQITTELISALRRFYGNDPKSNPDFGRIINSAHAERLAQIINKDRESIRCGGNIDIEEKYIEPTILCPGSFDAACMQEELFGPILPIFPYSSKEEACDIIDQYETPLALYIFSKNNNTIKYILDRTDSGGVCINDVISHILNPSLPFGGKGYSGMGAYHGKYSFTTFSHQRSILKKSSKINIKTAFPPYSEKKLKQASMLLK